MAWPGTAVWLDLRLQSPEVHQPLPVSAKDFIILA